MTDIANYRTFHYDKYIHVALMYTTDHILPLLPIKHFVDQDSEPNMPHELETGTKPSVSNLHLIFCLCFYKKQLHMVAHRR